MSGTGGVGDKITLGLYRSWLEWRGITLTELHHALGET